MISDKDILNSLSYEKDTQGILWCLPGSLFPDGRALKVLLPDASRGHIHSFINAVRGEYLARETSKSTSLGSESSGGVFNLDDLGSQDPAPEKLRDETPQAVQGRAEPAISSRPSGDEDLQDVKEDLQAILREKHRKLVDRRTVIVDRVHKLTAESFSLAKDIKVLEKLIGSLNDDGGNQRPESPVVETSGDKPQPRRRGRPPKKAASVEGTGDPSS